MSQAYAHPEVLVSTQWVAEHLNDPKVKILEVDVDTGSYDRGHIRNAIGWNWQNDLQDRVMRDVADGRTFAELCRRCPMAQAVETWVTSCGAVQSMPGATIIHARPSKVSRRANS